MDIKKTSIILLTAYLVAVPAFSTTIVSSGPRYTTDGKDNAAIGTLTWSNPTNIHATDDVYATVVIPAAGVTSHYLTAQGFGFSIPDASTIIGIVVEIEKTGPSPNGAPQDTNVQIIKGGVVGSENKAFLGTNWSGSDNFDSYGGATDLWSETWTPADINASTFGVAFACEWLGIGGTTVRVDAVRATVYYTARVSGGILWDDDL